MDRPEDLAGTEARVAKGRDGGFDCGTFEARQVGAGVLSGHGISRFSKNLWNARS
jgi:hypothetical protein